MRKNTLFIFICLMVNQSIIAQYLGGTGEGNSLNLTNASLSITDGLYEGGTGIGNSQIVSNLNLSKNDGLYEGGNVTGNNSVSILNMALFVLDGIYDGASGKGDESINIKTIRLSRCNDKQLVWNGNQSVFWNNDANWDCGTVPVANSIVTIPTSYKFAPIIGASAIASRVTVAPSANLYLIGGASALTLTGQ